MLNNKRKILSISCFVSGSVLFAAGLVNRLIDAQNYGNVWLAFQTDSFMGWPLTHITGFLSLAFFGFGLVCFSSLSVHAQDKEDSV